MSVLTGGCSSHSRPAEVLETTGGTSEVVLDTKTAPEILLSPDPVQQRLSVAPHLLVRYPERGTLAFRPKIFDRTAWTSDPQSYLNIIEPGRVLQSLSEDEEGVIIVPHTPSQIYGGVESAHQLAVIVKPRFPVSFHAFDGGVFLPVGLNSTTIMADHHGVAAVTWKATPGTIGTVNIMASSPLCHGNVNFNVEIQELP